MLSNKVDTFKQQCEHAWGECNKAGRMRRYVKGEVYLQWKHIQYLHIDQKRNLNRHMRQKLLRKIFNTKLNNTNAGIYTNTSFDDTWYGAKQKQILNKPHGNLARGIV